MLDTFFTDHRALRHLRSGAIEPHLDAFADHLSHLGYSREMARSHLRESARFGRWLDEHGLSVSTSDESTLCVFLEHLGSCRGRHGKTGRHVHSPAGVKAFLAWSRSAGVVTTEPSPSPVVPALLLGFEAWMLQHRGVTTSTLREAYRPLLCRLFGSLGNEPGRYHAATIRGFILEESRKFSRKSSQLLASAVRMFLRYCAVQELCSPLLADAVPTLAHWKLADLPGHLASTEVERLIAACDISHPDGRRNRVMLLLLARLGLRASDVAGLTFEDLDWGHATLQVSGKGRRLVSLPLSQEVGDALIAYLSDRRTTPDEEHLFLMLQAPYRALTASAVGMMVTRHAQKAGVVLPRGGSHILRHSLATSLLNEGMSLPAIGGLLRHTSLEATLIYAKVDFALLASVVQPFPGEVSP